MELELRNLLANAETATTPLIAVGRRRELGELDAVGRERGLDQRVDVDLAVDAEAGAELAVARVHRDEALVGRGQEQAVRAGGVGCRGVVGPVLDAPALEAPGIGRLVDLRIHGPARRAGGRLQGDHLAEGIAHDQVAAGGGRQQRRRVLEVDVLLEVRVVLHRAGPELPGQLELADVVPVDLGQRREAAAALVTAVVGPALAEGGRGGQDEDQEGRGQSSLQCAHGYFARWVTAGFNLPQVVRVVPALPAGTSRGHDSADPDAREDGMSISPESTTLQRGFVTVQGRLRHPAGALPARRPRPGGPAAAPVAPVLPGDGAAHRGVGPRLHADRARLAGLRLLPAAATGGTARDSRRPSRTSPARRWNSPMRWASAASASTATTPVPASARRSRTARPDRVAAVAANGLVVLTEDERAAILRDYLPPLVPRWDGGHLAWLWARIREQTIFFPWHDRRAATRMDFDVPPADRLQLGLVEFLAAGDHYHVAYAPRSPTGRNGACPAMRVPLLVTAAARDPLAGHLRRIGARSSQRPGGAVDGCGRGSGPGPHAPEEPSRRRRAPPARRPAGRPASAFRRPDRGSARALTSARPGGRSACSGDRRAAWTIRRWRA